MTANGTRQVMDEQAIQRALVRIGTRSSSVATDGHLALVGIRSRGVYIAQRLRRILHEIEGGDRSRSGSWTSRSTATTWTAACRTRWCRAPASTSTVDGRRILLVDDVLFTGRTIRAAMDALVDFGRPRADPARRAGRSRPPRAADPRRLRRQEPADRAQEEVSVRLAEADGSRRRSCRRLMRRT
jgi:pyrimidine operon attenuation protein/uracil phosphoribosyltransferase